MKAAERSSMVVLGTLVTEPINPPKMRGSAVASAGALAASGALSPDVAGRGAVLASAASALINLPLVARVGQDRALTRRVAVVLGVALLLGMVGAVGEILLRIARG